MATVKVTLTEYLEDEEKQTRTTVLSAQVLQTLSTIGSGDIAAGLQWLVNEHLKEHPAVRGPYLANRS